MSAPSFEPTFDENRWDEAVALMEVARGELSAERVDSAEAKARTAHALLSEVVGHEHPDFAGAVALLGSVSWVRGQIDQSEDRFRQALAVYDRHLGDPEDAAIIRPLRLGVLRRLAMVLSQRGAYDEAAMTHRLAIAEATLIHGEDSAELAQYHDGLGVCMKFQGAYAEAFAAYAESERLSLLNGQEPTPTFHHNMAGLLCAMGRLPEAECHARKAIALRRAEAGAVSYLGTDLCGLGDVLAGQGRFEEAEAAYREGIACYHEGHCSDHIEVAYALHNLGDVLVELSRPVEAEAAYLESIARKTKAFGSKNHEVAASLNNLAALYAQLGRSREARARSREALAAVRALSPEHPVREAVEAFAADLGCAS